MKREETYNVWINMRQRCLNPNNPGYKDYGGRGISIDPKWNSYAAFVSDMGKKPNGLSLDRIDNNGDYCKDNCRWIDMITQQRNTSRNTITPQIAREIKAVWVVWEGSKRSLAKAFEAETGINRNTIRAVLSGATWYE